MCNITLPHLLDLVLKVEGREKPDQVQHPFPRSFFLLHPFPLYQELYCGLVLDDLDYFCQECHGTSNAKHGISRRSCYDVEALLVCDVTDFVHNLKGPKVSGPQFLVHPIGNSELGVWLKFHHNPITHIVLIYYCYS